MRRLLLWVAPIVLVLLAACAAPARAALLVTDDLGRRLTLAGPPRRIISLAPSVTEILYAVGAGERLVADTDFCDYPPAARGLPHVGGPITPSAEKILALRPDLIVLAEQGLPPGRADALQARWRCPVYVTAAATYDGVVGDVARLGALAGRDGPTRRTVRRMRSQAASVAQAVRGRPAPRVFVVVWEQPLMTAGGGSFIGDLVRRAGGVNIAERTGGAYPSYAYPSYSPERLLRDQPDAVLTGANHTRLRFLGAGALLAVRAGRVYAVTGDLTDRPGPRLGDGLIAVARALHPEASPSEAFH